MFAIVAVRDSKTPEGYMKKIHLLCIFTALLFTSCARNGESTFDNCKTAKRHFGRGVKALCGYETDSRQVRYKDQFWGDGGGIRDEFVALSDDMGNDMIYMENVPQARDVPGDPGSGIPGIDSFSDPATSRSLSGIYRNVRFPFDSSLVKEDDSIRTVQNVADHMKRNPNVYVFVEGHCDERGPEAYNLALGTRRANSVRNMLVKEGISPERIYTVSYGKERPLVVGRDEETHSLNRRAQFRVYQR